MAEKRTITVPLRRSWQKTERHQRAKKASTSLRAFLAKHMKAEEVKIGPTLNEAIWARGIRKPPAKITVICEKDEDGIVHAELEGTPLPSDKPAKEE